MIDPIPCVCPVCGNRRALHFAALIKAATVLSWKPDKNREVCRGAPACLEQFLQDGRDFAAAEQAKSNVKVNAMSSASTSENSKENALVILEMLRTPNDPSTRLAARAILLFGGAFEEVDVLTEDMTTDVKDAVRYGSHRSREMVRDPNVLALLRWIAGLEQEG